MRARIYAPMMQLLAANVAGLLASDPGPDPRGPVRNVGMRVEVDKAGVQAKHYAFRNETAKPGPWKAEWIWLDTNEKPLAGLLRTEFDLDAVPERVHAWLSADVRYRVWINGRIVARGPADVGRDYDGTQTGQWLYDHRDLTPFFRKGRNVVAAEVYRETLVGSEVSSGFPGFLFEAELELPGGARRTIATDAVAWRGIPAPHLSRPTASLPGVATPSGHFRVDSTKEPIGWRTADFDARAWPVCLPAGNHWTPLVASEIPPPMEVEYPATPAFRPLSLKADGGFNITFDRVISAYIGLKIQGVAGATLTIMPNEPKTPGWHRLAAIALRDGVQYVELPFYDSFSILNFAIGGVPSGATVEIQDVRATFVSYPVSYQGDFACSDDGLNRIWRACRWANQICMQTHHLDSPHHQEPISDPGDYLIEALVNYYTFGEPWLARQDLRKYGLVLRQCKNRCFHTSYALLWLQMLLDYHDFTGDKALIAEIAPTAFDLLDTWTTWRGKNGLISEAPNYMFMDWVTIEGFACHHPPAVIGQGYITAFFCRGLRDARRIAEMIGDTARAERYERTRTETAAAFERELWSEEKGRYRDGKPFQTSVKPGQWLPADRDIETFSPHVSTLAVLYDLAPPARQKALLTRVLGDDPLNCQPYFMHFVFDAIDHAGLFESVATAQMRRWQIVPDTQTFREMWTTGDLSHAWIASPLLQMSGRILGVHPLRPGFAEIEIRPRFVPDLDWAKGTVPTPHGPVTVSWERSSPDGKIELAVSVPRGTTAVVTLGEARRERVGPGAHRFTI